MKCNICKKSIKENTEGDKKYCQGHNISEVPERVSAKFTRYCEECGEETCSFEEGVYGWEDGLCDLCWGLCDLCWKKKNGLCVECKNQATLGDFCKECAGNIPL